MANRNYDQVDTLPLDWEQDTILALLYAGTTFDASDKTVADLGTSSLAVQPLQGRWRSEDLAMGLPVAFQKVSADLEFQVVVAQNTGDGNPKLLAFIDANADDSPITVLRTGTLIIRPVLPSITVPPERPPTIGVWMKLPT